MRRRHRTPEDVAKGIAEDPLPTRIEGTLVDDPIDPSFTHEPMEAKEGKPDEFGIELDYFSERGQQTGMYVASYSCRPIRGLRQDVDRPLLSL